VKGRTDEGQNVQLPAVHIYSQHGTVRTLYAMRAVRCFVTSLENSWRWAVRSGILATVVHIKHASAHIGTQHIGTFFYAGRILDFNLWSTRPNASNFSLFSHFRRHRLPYDV